MVHELHDYVVCLLFRNAFSVMFRPALKAHLLAFSIQMEMAAPHCIVVSVKKKSRFTFRCRFFLLMARDKLLSPC